MLGVEWQSVGAGKLGWDTEQTDSHRVPSSSSSAADDLLRITARTTKTPTYLHIVYRCYYRRWGQVQSKLLAGTHYPCWTGRVHGTWTWVTFFDTRVTRPVNTGFHGPWTQVSKMMPTMTGHVDSPWAWVVYTELTWHITDSWASNHMQWIYYEDQTFITFYYQ